MNDRVMVKVPMYQYDDYLRAKKIVSEFETMIISVSLEKFGVAGGGWRAGCVGSLQRTESPWFGGPYGFVLRGARPLPFVPCRGRLGLYDVDQDVLDALHAAIYPPPDWPLKETA